MASGSASKWLKRCLRAAIGVVAIWSGGFLWFALTLSSGPPDSGTATQGIVVLTGGRDRMMVGVQLLGRGLGQRLLISGVNENISDDHLNRVLGLDQGPKPDLFGCCIDTGRDARDTVGNASELARWAAHHGYDSVRIVTAAYHMPRALVEIRRVAPSLTLVPHSVYPDNVKLDQWWAYQGTTRVLATEYNKYIVSLARLRLFGDDGGAA
jgi:uncharacterized SAM-binding protein YcdF (DUF218 family)